MKKATYIILLLAAILAIYCCVNRRSYFLGHFGNFNDIEIVTNDIIDEKQLVIVLITEKKYPIDTIYNKGTAYTIPEEYGPNKIDIHYKDSIGGRFIYWKCNRNTDHLYRFHFTKTDSSIYCVLNMIGDDRFTDTLRLSK